ncbi:MAG: 3-oxoacyl-ACP reductase FabG [Acidimicrobiales bacterium]|nr:3-oxoacyl-ACP reductase FabG [Acidimicrobiales bacterium]
MTDAASRVVLVTGGNRGIGLATAKAFAEAGHRVAITVRSSPPADADQLLAVPCDVTDPESIESAFAAIEQQLGPVEILVSNAGITRDGLVLRMGDADFTDVLDANLTGGFRMAKRAVKSMMRARFGRIIFVSSIVGAAGQAGQANYAASKAGLVGLARSLAKEFASRNVTVNVVAPGPIATDMFAELNPEQQAAITDAVPLGRVGEPTDVAAAIQFLASDAAGYLTGVLLPVDGGMAMGV